MMSVEIMKHTYLGIYKLCTHPQPPTFTHTHPHPPIPSQKKGHTHPYPTTPSQKKVTLIHTHHHPAKKGHTHPHPSTHSQKKDTPTQTQPRKGHTHPHLAKNRTYSPKFSRKCREKKIFHYPLGN